MEERTEIRAAESRIEFIVSGLFTLLLAGTLAYVWTLFAPIAPRSILNLWTALMGSAIAIMMAVPLAFLIRNPEKEEVVRVWARIGKVVAVLYDLAITASIWMLLPYANEDLRLLMLIFYISAISGQVISTAEALANNAFGIVAIFGSIVAFYLMTPGPYSVGIAVFCASFGLLMFVVAITLRQAVRSALVARLRAEVTAVQLADALKEAELERDGKARFIAAASHDLRQPLHAATLFFEQSQSAPSAEIRARAAGGVRAAFQSAGSLLDAILDHLKIDSGMLQPKTEPVCLDVLFRSLSELHGPQARAAGMWIDFRPTRHWVSADPALLERVLSNLIVNGIKHSRGERVLLSSHRRKDGIEVFVIDNGVGIRPDEREKIFDEYAQGGGVRLDPRGGLGLGLASSRRIMELHESHLDVVTTWTGGAGFVMTLRSVSPVAVTARPDGLDTPHVMSFDGVRILVVEDIEAAGLALVSLLESFGATSDWAGSVSMAGRMARDFAFDVMITDWRLSLTETGADAIHIVREARPDIPVIVLTGDGAPDTMVRIAETGARLLHKPASPDRLRRALSDVVPVKRTITACES